ncbi:FAD/FMN dependent oxidoreductase [Spironucleus salmonicida]|uniref:FAD/FMN dependent oxidoreductase n=1 Tax=Spironucleus salmonicida TaxID=348837 RepID=K7R5G9_9EUKA|nr:NADH oxidase [Spironucleus salmonicida]KAH0572145.1 FAD/FMN dependent oxidoreductase [Spironucleus salmonicida]|eukprot:EST47779.1 FAD/FMN dependent oxidoreductase [Spironucleus salmonicida]
MTITLPVSKIVIQKPYIKSATSERLADSAGAPHEEYSTLYKKIAQNRQIGLLISGHIAVSRDGRAEHNQIYFSSRDKTHSTLTIRNLKRMIKQYKASTTTPIIAQISHSGSQTPKILFPSHVYGFKPVKNGMFMFPSTLEPPRNYVIEQFSEACQIALKCGFDGVQLHFAHGYLGADCVENCPEFADKIFQSCRENVPKNKIFSVKLNSNAFSVPFIEKIQNDVDFVEMSAGSYSEPLKLIENHKKRYSAEFSEALMEKKLQCLVCATGGFYSIQEGQNALDLKQCNLVGFGRLFCLPGADKVVRLSDRGAVRQFLRKKLPLATSGPNTVFYQEILQQRGRGNEKWRLPRYQCVWEGMVLLNWAIGRTRYATKRAWRK